MIRCPWPGNDPLMIKYHDHEWGIPIHNDQKHFEFLVLEAAQAGLSWRTVLHKREGYRKLFANFAPEKVARFNAAKIKALMQNPAIIRNRLKIEAAVHNAKRFLAVQKEFGSFDAYSWQFVGGKTKINKWKTLQQIPATSRESNAFSQDLKKRGFKFVGPAIIYAYMQAVGMIDDHLAQCFCYRNIKYR